MNRRRQFIAYLTVLHLVFAALAAWMLVDSVFWLVPLELLFAASLLTAVALTRRLFRDAGFAHAGLQMLKEHDFASRLREIGHEEIDELIRLYNRMMDSMREERTRLQEQHHFLSHILRVSPSGILILDFDGRVSTANPAAERLLDVAPGALAAARLDALPPAGELTIGGRQLRCHHGSFIDRGFPRRFLLIEELTDEIRRAERSAYEKLIRVMAHEVNNSVTGVHSLLSSSLNYSRELAEDSRADFEHALSVIIERTDRLNQFMRQFAAVFRLPPPVKQPEAVVPLLEHCVSLMASRPDASGVRWEWAVEDPRLMVSMDRGQMEQAFLNVIKNAIEAMPDGGTIAIRVHSRPRPAVVVEDSGPDIAPEALANLFTPFFSTKPAGQGIGLTLVGEILAGHGFDYALERTDRGTTAFRIAFR